MKHILISIALFAFLSQSCCTPDDLGNCADPKTTTFNLTEAEKSRVNSTGSDTIMLMSNTGDTAICIGNGRQVSYVEKLIFISPYCDKNRELYEVIEYPYNDFKFPVKLNIQLHEKLVESGSAETNCIRIALNGKRFFVASEHIGLNTAVTYYGGRTFFNGQQFSNLTFILKDWYQYTDTVFYNMPNGICGAYIDGKSWVRIFP